MIEKIDMFILNYKPTIFADSDVAEQIQGYGNEIIFKIISIIGGLFMGIAVLTLIFCSVRWVIAHAAGSTQKVKAAKTAFFGSLGAVLLFAAIFGVGIGMMNS